MRGGVLILAMSLLAGCHAPDPPLQNLTTDEIFAALERHPKPPYQLLDRIEARLEGKPCIGRLDGWERIYSYDTQPTTDRSAPVRKLIDERHVLLDFRQVAPGAGRRILGMPGVSGHDAPVKIVLGRYDRTSDKVWIDVCGENFGGDTQPMVNVAF